MEELKCNIVSEIKGMRRAFSFLLRKEMEREIEHRDVIISAWKWKNDQYRQNAIEKERIKIENKYEYLFDGLRERRK